MIRHFVALRFREGTPDATKQSLMEDLAGLSSRIDGVLDFQARPNISPEKPMVRGFLDVFWFDFRDSSVRDTYLEDEAHKAIGARLVAETEGGTDGVFVADYEV